MTHKYADLFLTCVLLILGALALTGCQSATNSHALIATPPPDYKVVEATDWLARHEFLSLLTQKDVKESGKNFWDQGYSVGKLESRWSNGYQQYRVEIVENPRDRAFWWMWYFDMDKAQFHHRLHELSLEGYQLVSYDHNTTPAGGDLYCGVWNKE